MKLSSPAEASSWRLQSKSLRPLRTPLTPPQVLPLAFRHLEIRQWSTPRERAWIERWAEARGYDAGAEYLGSERLWRHLFQVSDLAMPSTCTDGFAAIFLLFMSS